MGGVSSVPTDGSSSIYIKQAQRFCASRLEVLYPSESEVIESRILKEDEDELQAKGLLEIDLNSNKSGVTVNSQDEDYLVEFVQVSLD